MCCLRPHAGGSWRERHLPHSHSSSTQRSSTAFLLTAPCVFMPAMPLSSNLPTPPLSLPPPSARRMSQSELACTYAALILHDDGLEITADNLNSILKVGERGKCACVFGEGQSFSSTPAPTPGSSSSRGHCVVVRGLCRV